MISFGKSPTRKRTKSKRSTKKKIAMVTKMTVTPSEHHNPIRCFRVENRTPAETVGVQEFARNSADAPK
jgi:hypothetical protein